MTTFPFIVGAVRSGTTLLRAMVDSHPDMAVPWESYFIVPMAKRRSLYERSAGFDADRFVADLRGTGFDRWDLPEEAARAAVSRLPSPTFPEAVEALYRAYAELRGKHRFGDKTPIYVLHLPLLARLFPNAKFVHLIRDGRDVALSLAEVTWGPKTIDEAAQWWSMSVGTGRAAGSELGPARYREVSYEALVAAPEAVLGDVCHFVGLPWRPEMLDYPSRAEDVIASDLYPEHHRRVALPPTVGLRSWRSDLPTEVVARFEAVAGPVLEEAGYPLMTSRSARG